MAPKRASTGGKDGGDDRVRVVVRIRPPVRKDEKYGEGSEAMQVDKEQNKLFLLLKDDDDPFVWEIMIMGPPETPYDGGFFRSEMIFPADYPNLPPKLKFVSEFYHPNVYPDGTVCISILHPPGEDAFGYEAANERWLPIHTVESILVSVLSMISSPNIESPANIDAGVRAMRHAPRPLSR